MTPLVLLPLAALAALADPPAAAENACVAGLATDLAACDGALAAESDPGRKANLLFLRAYARVEKYRYEDALEDLDQALRLDPASAEAYLERAYVLGELSEFARALRDADRAVELAPNAPKAYGERAFLRHRVGDFEGAYRDSARVAELKAGDSAAMLARGGAALWLGRFDDAARDTDEALRLARAASDDKAAAAAERQKRAVALWSDRTPGAPAGQVCREAMEKGAVDRPKLIGDCTAAFLAAKSAGDKAHMLTVRSLAWLVAEQDERASIADQVAAVALDPGNADWHANLGSSYVRVNHSWAGRRELDRSLAIKETWVALAGRAAARYRLQELEGAFADAKRSFELRPNEVALMVLGDLSRDKGDVASARLYWLGAYDVGGRDDGLLERLKSIGVEDPAREPRAK